MLRTALNPHARADTPSASLRPPAGNATPYYFSLTDPRTLLVSSEHVTVQR